MFILNHIILYHIYFNYESYTLPTVCIADLYYDCNVFEIEPSKINRIAIAFPPLYIHIGIV